MTSYFSLKDQPIYQGSTGYCDSSFHLANHKLAGARALESELGALNKDGPMLGTKMSYGRRKSRKGRRRYGMPFKSGKLSTSVNSIGLPLGAKSPVTIFDTMPDPLMQGSPLPRPYGPRDNLRMQSLYKIHGFGRIRRSRRSRRRKSRRRKSRRKSKSRRRKTRRRRKSKSRRRLKSKSRRRRRKRRSNFGMTPGTKNWVRSGIARNNMSAQAAKYANPGALKMAKGLFKPDVELIVPGLGNKQYLSPFLNEPLQFSNNQLNTPVLKFGKGKRRPKRRFGSFNGKLSNSSPNTVAYQKPIPMYHAGGTTINFATNQLYSPEGLIPKVGKVQPDGMTPNAWLTRSQGIGDGLGGVFRFGSKKKFQKPKLNKKKRTSPRLGYGSGVYTPNGWTEGSGHLTIKQPKPNLGPKKVTGSFMSYGKSKKLPKKSKSLKTNFGGKTITLDSSGKININ